MSEVVRQSDTRAPACVVDPPRRTFEPWRPGDDHQDGVAAGARRLGAALRSTRLAAGRTQREIADAAFIGTRHLRHLEAGERLTRRTTLLRLAAALAGNDELAPETGVVFHTLLLEAGDALADESDYGVRVAARRDRRAAQRERNEHTLHSVARLPLVGAARIERRVVDVPTPSGRARHRAVTFHFIDGYGGEYDLEPWPDLLERFAGFPVTWSRPQTVPEVTAA